MLVRMNRQITGYRNGEEWPAPGGTIEVPDHEGADLVRAGLATAANPEEVTDAVDHDQPGPDSDQPAATDPGPEGPEDDGDTTAADTVTDTAPRAPVKKAPAKKAPAERAPRKRS